MHLPANDCLGGSWSYIHMGMPTCGFLQAILTPARLLYNALGREGYIWLYSALDSMFGAAGGIADVGNHFGGAIAATGAAGLSAGLVLAAKGAGSKPKLA